MQEPLTLADLAGVDILLSEDERLVQDTVRRFVRERYLPRAAEFFEKESFPLDLVPELAELGLFGGFLEGYGCAGMNTRAYGLALEELEDGDGGPDSIRGFVVERGTPGFETPTIRGKMSLRASPTGEIVLNDCRIGAENVLGGARGLLGPLGCLNHARLGIAFGALGAARACYETAVDYTRTRIQFGVPIAKKQLVQEKLVRIAAAIVQGKLLAVHFARLKDTGRLLPQQPSLAKKVNVAAAVDAARTARSLLGANGILLAYPAIRHMLNLESVSTYDGTDEIHTLILGRALTGLDAF